MGTAYNRAYLATAYAFTQIPFGELQIRSERCTGGEGKIGAA